MLFSKQSSTRKQLSLLLSVLIGGTGVVSVAAALGVVLVRREVVHLAQDTSPTQIRLAKLEHGFERISGDFARISAASSIPELSAIEAELATNIGSVEHISSELGSPAGKDGAGDDAAVIDKMRTTGKQLQTIARERIAARQKVAESNRHVTLELEAVNSAVHALSAEMSRLQDSSQQILSTSTRVSLKANASIKELLAERLQTEQLRFCIQQTGLVEKRFRLNPLRDRADGILDGMITHELEDPALSHQRDVFVAELRKAFDGDAGIVSARAAILENPENPKIVAAFTEGQNRAAAEALELSSHFAEQVDELELAVMNARVGMKEATERIARVTAAASEVADVGLRARTVQALAWQLLGATDPAAVARIRGELGVQSDQALTALAEIRKRLQYFTQAGDSATTKGVPETFSRVRALLIGPGGVAADVTSDLDKQRNAAVLFDAALRSIRQVTAAGSVRALDSDREQEAAEIRIGELSATTLLSVGMLTVAALLFGSSFGRRVLRKVLAAERSQLDLEETLRRQAFHDPLTQLPNRLHFDELIAKEFGYAARASTRLAVLCVDLDRFKEINDKMGHRAGDLYLMEISRLMQRAIHGVGVVARVGGDEFAVLLTHAQTAEGVQVLADRLLEALTTPVWIENCALQAGGSIGIAIFPDDGADPKTLLKNADRAMYRAKQSGRNQWIAFDWNLNKAEEEHIAIQKALADGLRNGEFRILYQPQYDPAGRLVGAEALLRFRNPEFGVIPPSRFIPIAEESGLIVPLGEWVLREVVRQSIVWQSAGLAPIRLAVNVSALQFAHSDFLGTVTALLRDSGLTPELLELELTETTVISHLNETRRQMIALRSLGVRISIDDFGTGYSSLSYLHKLPVDNIKIDQSFVREMHASASTLPLIGAIVSAAHAFGLTVVAEGVETGSQKEALSALECDSFQGYYFSQPLPPDMLEALLRKIPDRQGIFDLGLLGGIEKVPLTVVTS